MFLYLYHLFPKLHYFREKLPTLDFSSGSRCDIGFWRADSITKPSLLSFSFDTALIHLFNQHLLQKQYILKYECMRGNVPGTEYILESVEIRMLMDFVSRWAWGFRQRTDPKWFYMNFIQKVMESPAWEWHNQTHGLEGIFWWPGRR